MTSSFHPSPRPSMAASPGQMSATALHAALQNQEDLVLLDVRERHELDLARIEGAVHIPMGEIVSRHRELDPSAHLVVMCHHGIRSWNVARFLVEQAGFQHVDNLSGGIDAWALEVDPTTPRY